MKAIWKWLAPPNALSLQAQIKKLEAATADFAKHAGKEVHQINQRLEVLEASARAAAQRAPCTWTQSPDPHMPDTFNATCGVVWTFTDGGPAENDVRFCPGCGAAVSVAAPEPEEDLYDLAVKADNGGQP
jgi:hypothetical protein